MKKKMCLIVVLIVSGFLWIKGIKAQGNEGIAGKKTLSPKQAQEVVDRAVVPARRDLQTDTDTTKYAA